MSLELETYATVTLNGSGNGTASAGPQVAEKWEDWSVFVSASTNTAEANGTLYRGSGLSAGEALGQTAIASSGATYNSGPGQAVRLGQKLYFAWAGGDPGAVATLKITGTRTPD